MEIKNYRLSLDIDFETLKIIGHETITAVDLEKDLILDCYDLDVTDVSFSHGKRIEFTQDHEAKKLILKNLRANPMPASSELHEIHLEYRGKVSDQSLHGIYKSRYDGGYFIVTDFEPNGARLLFPCIDDPKFKAEFDVEVLTQAGLIVTSNCDEKEVIQVEEKKSKHIFERTPRMSTYLFYLGIGNFARISQVGGTGIEFRALARPGYASKGAFALEHAMKFVQLFEDYYAVRYPLPKLDLIALPEYAAGAMENWGAITFRELGLLVDENSSASNKRSVAEVLGHEIAHQWFGDLVTMEWWNDLWLNESFATFMESKMTDILYPEWNIWGDFLHDNTGGAMLGDSLRSTHPIDVDVKSPEEISQIFDEISYGKGASILRMIEFWIGPDAFREGIRRFLTEFPYSNARGEDLWEILGQSSGLPVSDVMRSWITKPGFPVLKVSYRGNAAHFEQERLFIKRPKGEPGKFLWPIPVVASINGKKVNFLFSEKSMTYTLDEPLTDIKINSGQSGFYRVEYDQNLYSLIAEKLRDFSPFDRWGVISDLFAFLHSRMIEPALYFDFVKRSMDDDDYLVVDAIAAQLRFLRTLAPSNEMLKEIYLEYFRKQMARLGLESKTGEKDNNKILRGRIATGLALEDEEFAEKQSRKFPHYETEDPNIRASIAVSFARRNGQTSYDKLLATMKRMANEADVIKIFAALTSFKEPDLVKRSLDFCISGEVSRADSVYAISSATQNSNARGVTWEWVIGNIKPLQELFGGTPTVSFLLQEVISNCGIGREKEVKDYFSKNKIVEADKGITKGIELLEANSDLANRLSS